MYHVPNPVEASGSSQNNPRSYDTFLFIGRLNPEKGAVLFAQAAREAGARAVFVGDGQDRDKILQVNPQAQILGWKTPSEVQELIRTARCIVFPSLWYECQPLVPIEAIHAGVPVIAGQWTAASETVEHDRTGVLVDTPDVKAFASAITALLDDTHPVFERIQSYVPSYTPEAHQKALLETYRQVLQS
jgi:glycosyltransferase involved in cell wall biosynthesis